MRYLRLRPEHTDWGCVTVWVSGNSWLVTQVTSSKLAWRQKRNPTKILVRLNETFSVSMQVMEGYLSLNTRVMYVVGEANSAATKLHGWEF